MKHLAYKKFGKGFPIVLTVMLSLAMVVVASLIGAKVLGQDVLEALQYANVGQGILAGIAIYFVR